MLKPGFSDFQVLTGSFLLRLYSFPKHGLLPESILTGLAEKAPSFDKWAKAVVAHPSVTAGIWDEEKVAGHTKTRLAKLRASA
jgi:glutathione S-transferase